MTKTLGIYQVYAKLNLEVSVKIKAENLEDALQQSRKMNEEDFVKILGEYLDGKMKIIGTMAEWAELMED
jgi:hypothetical protein